MNKDKIITEEQARIIDILAQIEKLNGMIALHHKSDEPLMLHQYQDLKRRFLEELKGHLTGLGVKVQIEME